MKDNFTKTLRQHFISSLALLAGVLLGLTVLPGHAIALPSPDCEALAVNRTATEYYRAQLKPVDFDPQYRRAEILRYAVGADFSYLPQEGVGLIIFDNVTKRSTLNTVGFRRIGQTKYREASLQLYDYWQDGTYVVVTVKCTYVEN